MSLLSTCYKKILKPILFKFDPDAIHSLFINIGIQVNKTPGCRSVISNMYGRPTGANPIKVDGLKFNGPVLLSAGFDYNAHLSPILQP